MQRLTAAAGIAFAAVTVLATGCGGAGSDKAGGTSGPVVLRMANGYADLTYEPAVAYFVRRTRELSHGSLRIRVVSDWGVRGGKSRPDFEQLVVRDVAAGKADLGWVGTRVFDTLGVRSFQALTAPMLIDSYPLERGVVASPIPRRMLTGLAPLGVTGLAVLAAGLRKPIAVLHPLLALADWRGITFATLRSREQADAIRALGAVPTDAWSTRLTDELQHRRVQGFEKNLLVYEINGMQTFARYVTANVNLWPETAALIASPDSLSRLDAKQRGWLEQAAADAAARSTGLTDVDNARLVRQICRDGGRVANASPADLSALRRAFRPVYAELERDSQTRRFVTAIQRLKASTPPGAPLPIPAACRPRPALTLFAGASRPPKREPTALDGVYRIAWTKQELLAAGTSRSYAVHNYGVITMRMRDGRFVWPAPRPVCSGFYTVKGRTVSFLFTVYCTGAVLARWSLSDGQLHLHMLGASSLGDAVFFTGKPWRKIG